MRRWLKVDERVSYVSKGDRMDHKPKDVERKPHFAREVVVESDEEAQVARVEMSAPRSPRPSDIPQKKVDNINKSERLKSPAQSGSGSNNNARASMKPPSSPRAPTQGGQPPTSPRNAWQQGRETAYPPQWANPSWSWTQPPMMLWDPMWGTPWYGQLMPWQMPGKGSKGKGLATQWPGKGSDAGGKGASEGKGKGKGDGHGPGDTGGRGAPNASQ